MDAMDNLSMDITSSEATQWPPLLLKEGANVCDFLHVDADSR